MSVNIQPEEKKCGDKIVFGTCNHYFTQFRKYRQWDSQKQVFCTRSQAEIDPSSASEVQNSDISKSERRNSTPLRSQSFKWTTKTFKMKKWQPGQSNDSKEGNCGFEEKLKDKRKLKHSLLRVGSDKYLANFKTQKDYPEQRSSSCGRPRLSLRKKSFSVDTEMLSEVEKTRKQEKCQSYYRSVVPNGK